jgi:hypothetical protein
MRAGVLVLVLFSAACGRDEPAFLSVLTPNDTFDTVGPYRVEVRVAAPNGVFRLLLRLQQEADSAVFSDMPFSPIEERFDGGEFFLELPGRPAGTRFAYYLLLVDGKKKGGGALVREPEAAPAELHEFEILSRALGAP